MIRIFGTVTVASVLLALVGCGGNDTVNTTDAGMHNDMSTGDMAVVDMTTTDTGNVDMGTPQALPTCASPRAVTGELDTTATITIDTTGGVPGTLSLTECGAAAEMQVAPQAVIAYTVPGTGDVTLLFTTDTEGSDAELDTVVEIITDGPCADAPIDSTGCFDDINYTAGNVKSGGTITATGGSTIFFILTGYADAEGVISLDVHPFINTPPVLTTATLNVGTIRALARLTGSDTTMDVDHATVRLLGPEATPLDLNDDGMVDATDTVSLDFDTALTGMATFTGTISLGGAALARVSSLEPVTAEFTLVDVAGAASSVVTATVTYNSDSLGAACSEASPCGNVEEISCVSETCTASAAVGTACEVLTPITVATPAAGSSASGMTTGTTGVAASGVGGTCQRVHLTPSVYSVVVPEGAYDLIATTDVAGTDAMADTVLSVRSTCSDISTERACNDDAGEAAHSTIEYLDAPAGTYALFVDQYVGATPPTAGLAFGLQVTLRSVIDAGATCDPTGVMNRCSTGACPTTGTAVCPAAVPTP